MAEARVGVVLNGLAGGGAERVLLDVARELIARGRSVDLVLLSVRGEYREVVPRGCRVFGAVRLNSSRSLLRFLRGRRGFHHFSANGMRTLLYWGRYRQVLPPEARRYCSFKLARDAEIVRRYIRERQPTALLSGPVRANCAAVLGRECSSRRPKVAVTVHNNYDRELGNDSAGKVRARALYPIADRVVGVSLGAAKCAARMLGLSPDRVCHIHNGFAIAEIEAKSRLPIATNSTLFVDEVPIIFNASRLVRGGAKDFDTLITAFAKVRQEIVARLVFLSHGYRRGVRLNELLDLAARLGIRDDVVFLNFNENPFPYMRAASVLVLSSRWEGFSNVLVEAMACGTPVVSTDSPFGPSEVLDNGRYGPLVPVGDAHRMAAAILSVLRGNHPRPEELRARANEFSVKRSADEYENVLFG